MKTTMKPKRKTKLYDYLGVPRECTYELTKGINAILSGTIDQLKAYMNEHNINTADFANYSCTEFRLMMENIGHK